jgi:hypothetical protein
MMTVPLHGNKAAGRVALVDDEDYDLVMQHSWYVWEKVRPTRINGPYALASIRPGGRKTTISMHKLITGYVQTDHKDHNGLNNQRSNLRPATRTQNLANQRGHSQHSSQYKGVSWNKNGHVWHAAVSVDGRHRHLGFFVREADAAHAYDDAARVIFGEFACLNFPDDPPGVTKVS